MHRSGLRHGTLSLFIDLWDKQTCGQTDTLRQRYGLTHCEFSALYRCIKLSNADGQHRIKPNPKSAYPVLECYYLPLSFILYRYGHSPFFELICVWSSQVSVTLSLYAIEWYRFLNQSAVIINNLCKLSTITPSFIGKLLNFLHFMSPRTTPEILGRMEWNDDVSNDHDEDDDDDHDDDDDNTIKKIVLSLKGNKTWFKAR